MNDTLFPWQKKLITDITYGTKSIVLEKSRRVGGTFCVAIGAVHHCLFTGHNSWFSSSDEKNGKEFMRYVRDYCGVLNAILGTNYIDLSISTTENVTLPNKARISSLSSNPTALRGKDGLIILDEVALHEDQLALFTAAHGCIAQKGKRIVLSTHNGPATEFYRIAKEAEAGSDIWSHHKVTIVDAVKEGYAKRFSTKTDDEYLKFLRESAPSEDAFGQEFMCQPLSLQALIHPDQYEKLKLYDITDCLDPAIKHNPLFIGIDVGRVHDLTVVWVLEQFQNISPKGQWDLYDYKTICVHAIKNQPIPQQYQTIKPILAHLSVSGIVIDQGTVGRALADAVLSDFGFAEPITFTSPKKAEMAERVKGYVAYEKISLPKTPIIQDDILSLRRIVSSNGGVSYDGSTKETHCDYFWSCAMALESAANGNRTILV